ncbi:tRNA-(ms[2]io[6]A)-hydroxylase [Paraliomyxa miuraensis]|uniref:tRNA-(ms[2]io[6]A)-hydroxylase n=1 Tax=Paraliomyxa miuraensis TaxID=376150 RepID=UPI002256C150|nr:tRNA-(ms[2]io[6]A)-hydroxylase [Paraliomyxa miuraensis]MCX4247271.1 tRNA-(ms[2]io[6]A)-hydroxylase [Paraliomyxa miuraensis]
MLHLRSHSSPEWPGWALAHLDEILLDHAHCEKKAASTAINLIFRYTQHESLMEPLSALAREELEHFELVLGHLRRRGRAFVRQQPSAYASRLMEVCRKHEPGRVIDTLLCCSMIEARSCERMQRLHGALAARCDAGAEDADPALALLYESLLASEARHHATYVDLARGLQLVSEDELRARLHEIAEHEASVVARASGEPRLHDGP